jgi:TATA-box binding protein (TBP) (component of TFIID and TFIIIB)
MDVSLPKELRISTHTATCNLGSFLNLKIIYKYLDICDKISYIEYANYEHKGISSKVLSKRAKNKKKIFFNQITIIVKPCENRSNNIKLFNNGAISMTGLKNFDEGHISINILLEKLKAISGIYFDNLDTDDETTINEYSCDFCSKIHSKHNIKTTTCEHNICNLCSNNIDTLINTDNTTKIKCNKCNKTLNENAIEFTNNCKIKDYNIVLINSDFYVGFEIKRTDLHELLTNTYHIFSSYEPCIYPGVNSKYYFNELYENEEFKGKCYCDVYCSGKGNASGNGNCKKITISIFQSGSIIITGARNVQQINIAYNFINKVINDNKDAIKKNHLILNNTQINYKQKIIKLKKHSIIDYPHPPIKVLYTH